MERSDAASAADLTTDGRIRQLTEKVANFEAENAARLTAMEDQNCRLRQRVAMLEGRPPVTCPAHSGAGDVREGDLSRRGLFRRVGAATAAGAGMAVGASLLGAQPAAAGTDGDLVLGAPNNAGNASTSLSSSATGGTLNLENTGVDVDNANALFGDVTDSRNMSAAIWGRTVSRGGALRGSALAGGVSLQADAGRAHLLLVPAGSTGAPSTGEHNKGEVFVDAAGIIYECVADGNPGTWRKIIAGAPGFSLRSGSLNFLVAPVRLLDTRTGNLGKLSPGVGRDVQVTGTAGIPAGAVGVVGNLAVTQTENTSGFGGYLTAYPQGITPPTTANLNWFGANQNLSNTVVVALNLTNGRITIANGLVGGSSPTHVVFDVAGFVF